VGWGDTAKKATCRHQVATETASQLLLTPRALEEYNLPCRNGAAELTTWNTTEKRYMSVKSLFTLTSLTVGEREVRSPPNSL